MKTRGCVRGHDSSDGSVQEAGVCEEGVVEGETMEEDPGTRARTHIYAQGPATGIMPRCGAPASSLAHPKKREDSHLQRPQRWRWRRGGDFTTNPLGV